MAVFKMRIEKISLSSLHGPDKTECRPFTGATARIMASDILCHLGYIDFPNADAAQQAADSLYREFRDYDGPENYPATVLVILHLSGNPVKKQ